MSGPGQFHGIGVGPGPAGFLPVAALEVLRAADVIYAPRATTADESVALQCLAGLDVPRERVRELEFNMDPDRNALHSRYAEVAEAIAAELMSGRNVAYLTLGDPMTYSTYGYTLMALRDLLPAVKTHTLPGITSFAAAAAALGWPLGEGKERVLILPCPEDAEGLRRDVETHDVVVLMKIGRRLPMVLGVLRALGITQHCALVSRLGLPGERICEDLARIGDEPSMGYLATMLIRRAGREIRHASGTSDGAVSGTGARQ